MRVSSSLVPLFFAAALGACASGGAPAGAPQQPASSGGATEAPRAEAPAQGVTRIAVTAGVANSRIGGRAVALEATLAGGRWSWRGVRSQMQYGDSHLAAQNTRWCTAREEAPVAPIAERLALVRLSEHEERGGSGEVTFEYERDGRAVRTQLACALDASGGAGLCDVAQRLVGAYLQGTPAPPPRTASDELLAGGIAGPGNALEARFNQRTAGATAELCGR